MIEVSNIDELSNVVININEYRDLIMAKKELDILKSALFASATLSYSGDSLTFNGDVIKILFQREYEDILRELQEEKYAQKD